MSAPIQAVTGAIGLANQMSASKKANAAAESAARAQNRLLGIQAQTAQKQLDYADKYDPALDTTRGMLAYDTAANQSLDRDIGRSTVAQTALGMAVGDSSDANSGVKQVLSARAGDRANFLAGLKLSETPKKQAAYQAATSAAGSLTPAISQYGGIADRNYGIASGFDPSGSIAQIAAGLKDFNLPWLKRKSGTQSVNPNIMPLYINPNSGMA